jgi:hypothetical protein
MIEIIALPKVAEDERGPTHYFDTDRSKQFVCGFTEKKALSAQSIITKDYLLEKILRN